VEEAHDDAASGSVLFLAPGLYNEDGEILLDKTIKLFSVGKAVIQP